MVREELMLITFYDDPSLYFDIDLAYSCLLSSRDCSLYLSTLSREDDEKICYCLQYYKEVILVDLKSQKEKNLLIDPFFSLQEDAER